MKALAVMAHRTSRGFSFISIVLSLLIGFALMVLYLKAFTPVGPKGGTQGGALEAARKQAENFEEQQKKRLQEIDQITH